MYISISTILKIKSDFNLYIFSLQTGPLQTTRRDNAEEQGGPAHHPAHLRRRPLQASDSWAPRCRQEAGAPSGASSGSRAGAEEARGEATAPDHTAVPGSGRTPGPRRSWRKKPRLQSTACERSRTLPYT